MRFLFFFSSLFFCFEKSIAGESVKSRTYFLLKLGIYRKFQVDMGNDKKVIHKKPRPPPASVKIGLINI